MHRCCIITAAFVAALLPTSAWAQDKVTYDDHAYAIFQQRCFSCHNTDKAKGGLDLSTYLGAMTGSSGGEIVEAGEPQYSTLFLVINHDEQPIMPPEGGKLPGAEIELIRKWIAGGMLETTGSTAKKKQGPAVDLSLGDVPMGRPEGPPPMPEHVLLEPVVVTERPFGVAAMATSPWAPLVAINGQQQVLLYNTDSLRLVGVLPFAEGDPRALTFSENASLVLAGGGRGGESGRVVVWTVADARRVIEVGKEFDSVLAADISADQTQIALGGPSSVVKLYRTADGELLHEIDAHTDWIMSIAYSHDGVLVATGDRNGGLYVWESYTGGEFYTLAGHEAAVTAIAWRDDSNLLATASKDGTLRLWEMFGGKQVKSIKAHDGGVMSVAFSHDGRIVTTGRDKTVKLWDGDGNAVATLGTFDDVTLQAAFTHDDKRVIASDWTGAVRVFEVEGAKAVGELPANPPALQTRIAMATDRVGELTPVYQQAQQAYEQAEAAAQDPRQRLAAQQKVVEQVAATVKAAEQVLSTMKAAVVKATADHAAAVAGVDAAKQQVAEITKAHDDAVHHRGEAEIAWKKSASSVESKQGLVERLLASAAEAKAEADKNAEDATSAEVAAKAAETAATAQQALAEAQAAAAAAKAEHEKLTATAAQVKTAMDSASAALAQAEALAAVRQQGITTANAAVAEADQTLAQVTATATTATQKAGQITAEVKQHNEQVAAAKQAAEQAHARLVAAQREQAAWQAALINVDLLAVRGTLEQEQAVLAELATVTATTKAAHDQTKAALDQAQAALDAAPGVVAQNEQQLAAAQKAVADATTALQTAQATAKAKQDYAQQMRQQAEDLTAKAAAEPDNTRLAEAVTHMSSALAMLTEDATAAGNVIGGCQTTLEQMNQQQAAATTTLDKAKASLAAAPGIVAERTTTYNTAKSAFDQAHGAEQQQRGKVAEIQDRVDKLASQYNNTFPAS
jgi:hypothetical protein